MNGLTIIPFLVKSISMAVYEKKGEPGWIEIQEFMGLVSSALVTFHNDVLQQEKIMQSICDEEWKMISPALDNTQHKDSIIKCVSQFATVMRVVLILADMANAALSGGNDLQQLANLLKEAHTTSGFSPSKIINVFGECSFSGALSSVAIWLNFHQTPSF